MSSASRCARASAVTVDARAVYAPPGPVLLLTRLTDPGRALTAVMEEALRLGCAAVVVTQAADDEAPAPG